MSNKSGSMAKFNRLVLMRKFGPISMFVIMFAAISIASPSFLRWTSLMNVLRQCAVFGILALGESFVIMAGGIDLSVGAVSAASGCLIALLNGRLSVNPLLSVLSGIVLALVIGVLNGWLTAKIHLPDFIATLGTSTVLGGLALVFTNKLTITGIDSSITFLGMRKDQLLGIPFASMVFFAVALISWLLLEKTVFGRNVLAIGGNTEAARVAGINVVRTKVASFILSALFGAMGGIVLIGRLNSANALMGAGYELNAIAAVVIGGTSINGGTGKVTGTVLGVLTMGIIQTGMDLMGMASAYQDIVLGAVIILVVMMDVIVHHKLKEA